MQASPAMLLCRSAERFLRPKRSLPGFGVLCPLSGSIQQLNPKIGIHSETAEPLAVAFPTKVHATGHANGANSPLKSAGRGCNNVSIDSFQDFYGWSGRMGTLPTPGTLLRGLQRERSICVPLHKKALLGRIHCCASTTDCAPALSAQVPFGPGFGPLPESRKGTLCHG